MDQQVRDEHLDQAAPHSVGHNTSQITATFMIYGGGQQHELLFAPHVPHVRHCCDASSVIVEDKAQADDWASEGCPQHRLDARADAPGACRSSEKELHERINEAIYGY